MFKSIVSIMAWLFVPILLVIVFMTVCQFKTAQAPTQPGISPDGIGTYEGPPREGYNYHYVSPYKKEK